MTEPLVTPSSGNVYRDMDILNADVMLAKANVVVDILRAKRARKLSDAELAVCWGVAEEDVRDILRGHFQDVPHADLVRHLEITRGQTMSRFPPVPRPPLFSDVQRALHEREAELKQLSPSPRHPDWDEEEAT